MRKVNSGSETCLSAVLLVIATLLLAGCSGTDTAAKPEVSGGEVDDLFAGLQGKTAPAPGQEINRYIAQIAAAIQSHFQYDSVYAGKECSLRLKLAPDGMLLDVRAEGGDPALCRAAVVATANASFPKPPTPAVYAVVKNAALEFRPQ
ncbi:cell envelope integrity protein TolA [Serratia liquefaciens]|uniref:cell envelope integrity protein TolA n=1 Tax=Serratia liquefaciens TaxID=614 RepID=UPI00065FF84B|nr:cell envelope integrity protein TolA [Serratia liquefaciens]AMG98279.1 cell envelope integrity protein TolA [Serratia liquefaciens]HEI8953685.1 cell envelope integrity protein TolA [Serratia liquefaciens]